jgi:SAM-dependent methyltransferase
LADKRKLATPLEDVQAGNQGWWAQHPMAYDWHGEVALEPLTPSWFDAIDERFLHAARLFSTSDRPFDRLIPYERLRGRSVLEIGCGMGLHSELLARAGADLTCVDITDTAIDATKRRLGMKALEARVMRADAEELPFQPASFDFVWSWGVIHHSARTARIVREIGRVTKDTGECRAMVYNRDGTAAYVTLLIEHLLKRRFVSQSFDDTLWQATDGFSARYYTKDLLEDMFRGFFSDVDSQVCGQDADAVPLTRGLRKAAMRFVPEEYLRRAQAKRGGFLFVMGRKPLR